MGFRLVPPLVTLHDLERRNILILRYFTEIDRLRGRFRHTVVENRPIKFGASSSSYILVKNDARSSRTVSLRHQLSFLVTQVLCAGCAGLQPTSKCTLNHMCTSSSSSSSFVWKE